MGSPELNLISFHHPESLSNDALCNADIQLLALSTSGPFLQGFWFSSDPCRDVKAILEACGVNSLCFACVLRRGGCSPIFLICGPAWGLNIEGEGGGFVDESCDLLVFPRLCGEWWFRDRQSVSYLLYMYFYE